MGQGLAREGKKLMTNIIVVETGSKFQEKLMTSFMDAPHTSI
jgi:hypothetical protein